MYFGFGLTTDLPCSVADCYFDLDDKKAQTYMLGVYSNEVDIYRNALVAIRNTRSLDDFDHRYQELTVNPAINVTFFKCKKIISDYVGINRIADKTFQSLTVSFGKPLEHKGRVKTGYKEIDDFVNKFTLVDLDSMSIYSPYKNPFNTQADNDFHKLLCTYSGQDIVVGTPPRVDIVVAVQRSRNGIGCAGTFPVVEGRIPADIEELQRCRAVIIGNGTGRKSEMLRSLLSAAFPAGKHLPADGILAENVQFQSFPCHGGVQSSENIRGRLAAYHAVIIRHIPISVQVMIPDISGPDSLVIEFLRHFCIRLVNPVHPEHIPGRYRLADYKRMLVSSVQVGSAHYDLVRLIEKGCQFIPAP